MKRDDVVYLRHILDVASVIGTYTSGLDGAAFATSSRVLDGVVRQLEIIGEASKPSRSALKISRGALACCRSNARQTDS